jgi:hypothetical protein
VTVQPRAGRLLAGPLRSHTVTRCPFPTPVTVGSAVTLDLTAGPSCASSASAASPVCSAPAGARHRGFPTADARWSSPPRSPVRRRRSCIPADTPPAPTAWWSRSRPRPAALGAQRRDHRRRREAPRASSRRPRRRPPRPRPRSSTPGLRSNTGVEAVETGSTGHRRGRRGCRDAGSRGRGWRRRRPHPSPSGGEGGTCA